MHVIVLGAGVVGVATAWYLRMIGHAVTVVRRRVEPIAGIAVRARMRAEIDFPFCEAA